MDIINKFYNLIKTKFNQAAKSYDQNAVLQHEIGARLVDRLSFFKLNPDVVLDLGMASGQTTNRLIKYLNGISGSPSIVGLDIAEKMLVQSRKILNIDNNIQLVCGDFNRLPIEDNSVDLIFSNFSIQWAENITTIIQECYRVLKADGLFIFTVPGPDSLYELRESFREIDPKHDYVNNFIDMHNIGDILMQNKFAHPVMDNDYFTLTYSSVKSILKDLKNTGTNINLSLNTNKSLFTKSKLDKLTEAYHKFQHNNKFNLTYEVIYGHAFKLDKPVKAKYPELSEVSVPIEKIIKDY